MEKREAVIRALWQAAAAQDAGALGRFFTEDAVILWPNTEERFTVREYIQANCAYPGQWEGQVEQLAADGSAAIARVWNREGEASRAVAFYQWRGEQICRMEEYWGDIAAAPSWRQKLAIGVPLQEGDALLPSAVPIGRCGFHCAACPDWEAGTCAGCRDAHVAGDCFTRDCTEKRGLPFCTLCTDFPCGELLRREKATVLDKAWMQWKRRE